MLSFSVIILSSPCFILQGNSLNKSVVEIERFPRTGVDQNTINTFLTVSQ